MNSIEVKSDKTGSWTVRVPGDAEAKHFHRQRDAQLAARRIAQHAGGGEVIVHARSGRIAERIIVPPAATARAASHRAIKNASA